MTRWLRVATTVLALAAMLLPFYVALVGSFSDDAALFTGMLWRPRAPTLENYAALVGEARFWVPVVNSLIVAGSTTQRGCSFSSRSGSAASLTKVGCRPRSCSNRDQPRRAA